MNRRIIVGDCLKAMAKMRPRSVDAIVTDPPYGLKFMGKDWDSFKAGDSPMRRQAQIDAVNAGASRQGGRQRACADYQKRQARDMRSFHESNLTWAVAALRVAKPGAHLVAFGGTRTHHRLMCAVEDAGWEIRDCLMWLYGSGFPKSLNGPWGGTGLKPGWEPIILARKPLAGTVAANVREHGTGGLNVDGCRIETTEDCTRKPSMVDGPAGFGIGIEMGGRGNARGRWPANVILDEQAGAMLDEQAGERGAFAPIKGTEPTADGLSGPVYGKGKRRTPASFYADSGGPSRFFYCAKASRSEREAGLRDGGVGALRDGGRSQGRFNDHPTVKPIALMRWLCRLVTPPGGLVLDPFSGSGTTGGAAVLEGFGFVGIEKDRHYAGIARRRMTHWAKQTPQRKRRRRRVAA